MQNGLYPIIRRIRRPLLPADPSAESKPVPISEPVESKPVPATASDVGEETKPDASDSNK
jgi:hypothetical protein